MSSVNPRLVLRIELQRLLTLRGLYTSEDVVRVTGMARSQVERVLNGNGRVPRHLLDEILQRIDAVQPERRPVVDAWRRLEAARAETEAAAPEPPEAADPAGLHRLREDAAGYTLKPSPLTATSKEEFLAVMREFHIWAGEPSYREIALKARKSVGASTLCEALDPKRPPRLPTLKVVTAFVYGCGGGEEDLTTWTTAWRQVRLARTADPATTARPRYI
ncbi:hypothetical protein ACIBG7_23470 [Nonomuraea sp. NPDC050328]|uniref:hypothetical protein n=1 Tax=Nonomuraea sp. NPDC050328 TaxID=3364361 RepID=UPI00379C5C76